MPTNDDLPELTRLAAIAANLTPAAAVALAMTRPRSEARWSELVRRCRLEVVRLGWEGQVTEVDSLFSDLVNDSTVRELKSETAIRRDVHCFTGAKVALQGAALTSALGHLAPASAVEELLLPVFRVADLIGDGRPGGTAAPPRRARRPGRRGSSSRHVRRQGRGHQQ